MKNGSYSYIKQIAEIGVTTLISAYFFTAGYINSFSLPIRVDFFQSGYFLITLLTDSVPTFLFNVFTGILKLPIYIYSFFSNLPPDFHILYKIILQPVIDDWIFIAVTVTTILIILIMFFIKLKFPSFLRKILTPFVFLWRKTKVIYPPYKFIIIYISYITLIKIILDYKGFGIIH